MDLLGSALVGGTLQWVIEKLSDEAGTRVAEARLRRIFQKRADNARDKAMEEIRAGCGNVLLDAPAEDEFVAIVWRYLRAAEEGTAHLNLRLMAAVLAGQINAKQVHASEFLRWSDLISSLSEVEIIFLATLHRESQCDDAKAADAAARRHLIPNVLADEDEFELTARALMRTGLVRETAALLASSTKVIGQYSTSQRMAHLTALADLEGVLSREGRR